MSERKRSFWSSIPGLVTGLAGLLTGIVGLVTVLIQLDVIGGDDDDKDAGRQTTVTTTAGIGSSGTAATPTTEAGSLAVEPTALVFRPVDQRDKTVTVKNTSNAASLTVSQPRITGEDSDRFTAKSGTCDDGPLKPNLTCTVTVTFSPGALRDYKATLQIDSPGAPRGVEVRLSSTLV